MKLYVTWAEFAAMRAAEALLDVCPGSGEAPSAAAVERYRAALRALLGAAVLAVVDMHGRLGDDVDVVAVDALPALARRDPLCRLVPHDPRVRAP